MKMPEDISPLLMRHFQNKHYEWLSAGFAKNQRTITVKLGVPTEQTALKQTAGVRAWVAAWQAWRGAGQLFWCERRWKMLGIQRLPEKLVLKCPEEIIAWIGETPRWQQANIRYQKLVTQWPKLTPHLSQHFDVLADYSETDFECLYALLTWFDAHPNSNLYPRQLPVVGVDSKWLERHKKLLNKLVAGLHNSTADSLNFYQRCGLKAPPLLMRMRILDPSLRTLVRGIGDITAPIEDFMHLNLPAKYVFIVENLQTGLAMPDLPAAIVFIHLGYHVDALAHLPWINQSNCVYWGDIDTHGFAILHRARSYLPHLQSIMMDEETLLYHKNLWGNEEKQNAARELSLLTKTEHAVYHNLKQQRWGQNIRLEQERIHWSFVQNKLHSLDFLPQL